MEWFVIITSRSMCIKRELEEKKEIFKEGRVTSFEPITALQQDLIINRMIELNKEQKDLEEYQLIELPKLRRNEELRKLLGIPILFRMIVAVRFTDDNSAETKAELYGSLFSRLMDYKGKKKIRQICSQTMRRLPLKFLTTITIPVRWTKDFC